MNFKYENNKVYLTDAKGTNIEQPFWEDTYEPFKDYMDAKDWVVRYLSKNLNTSIIYFDVVLKNEDDLIEENHLSINKLYKVFLKESTQQLIGRYDILITLKDEDNQEHLVTKTVSFTDGEGEFDIVFTDPGTMEIHLENTFLIGEQEYVFINDTTRREIDLLNTNNPFIYIIE